MALKRTYLAHPFAFAFVCAMYLYQRAEMIASPQQVVRPLLLMWALLGIVGGILYLMLRDRQWTALLLAVFAIALFSDPLLSRALGLSAALIALGWWTINRLVRGQGAPVRQINLLLAGFALFLAVVAFGALIMQLARIPSRYSRQVFSGGAPPGAPGADLTAERPDIYWIILDAYAGGEVLQREFHFDNSQFENQLTELGFIFPPAPRSNYSWTLPSMASTLNMDYLANLMPGLEDSRFDWLMTPLVQRSRVRSTLEGLGYHTVTIADEYRLTDNPATDFYLRAGRSPISDYEFFLLGTTPVGLLRPVLEKYGFVVSNKSHQEMVLSQFDVAAHIPELPSPKFAIVHMMSPHPPFVFGPDGDSLSPTYPFSLSDGGRFPGSKAEYVNGYTGQVQFVNQQTEQLIRTILQNSPTPPIIIVQADHGARIGALAAEDESSCLADYFTPFAAYYLPGMRSSQIPPRMSSVNLFRFLFDHYFGTDLGLLEDRSFLARDGDHLFDPVEVTDRLDAECARPPQDEGP